VTAAVRALVDHGFGELGLHRVEIGAAPDSTGSCAVAQRLGFTREGTRREAERHHDRYRDIVLYSLLRPEREELLRR
jgi:ribosomal-protein-serine acetyltransferase